MIARHNEDGHAAVGDATQRLECLVGEGRAGSRVIENVAGMDDDVDFTVQRRRQRAGVVGQEVVTAPPALDAGPLGQVESEM